MVKIKVKDVQERNNSSPVEEFKQALQSAGLRVDFIDTSGNLMRVATSSDRGFKKSGWYIYYDDPVMAGGAYGSWKDGLSESWSSRSENTLSQEDILAHRDRVARMKAYAEKKRKELQEKKAVQADIYISGLQEAVSHAYADKKSIKLNGALIADNDVIEDGGYVARAGELIIPAYSADGDIQTYQRISASGDKLFYKGGAKDGAFFVIGDIEKSKNINLCEGYSTGSTIFDATETATVVCFDSGNLIKVSALLCEKYKDKRFLICGDNDAFTKGNPGEKAAMEAANHPNASYVLPSFDDLSSKPTDFNDLQNLSGVHEVTAQITGERPAFIAEMVDDDFFENIPKRRFLYGTHLIRGYVSCTIAAGGVGKTQLSMIDCISLATGRKISHHQPHETCNAWHFNLEDPKDELRIRMRGLIDFYKIDKSELRGKVAINSGRDQKLIIAERTKDGQILPRKPNIEALKKAIIKNKIGLVSIDPFVKSHYVDENSNKDIDEVLSIYAQIAHDTQCSFDLIHHITKPPKGYSIAGDINAGRGASALAGAVRSGRTLVPMSEDEAKGFGIDEDRRLWFVREDSAKSNMSPPASKANWYQRHGVTIANGSSAPILQTWEPKNPLDTMPAGQAEHIQRALGKEQGNGRRWSLQKSAKSNWAATAIVHSTGRPLHECEAILKAWIDDGVLYEAEYEYDGKHKRGLFLNENKIKNNDCPF